MAFRFEKLEIWSLAIEYADKVYNIANGFPKEELFGLSSQLKRAAVSISNNIAEGSGSSSNRDFKNFLDIAIKSTVETVSSLSFANKRKYLTDSSKNDLYEEADKLIRKITAFKNSLG